nr:MAG TPA: hypothetical protein [Caudoviricetes sp.]
MIKKTELGYRHIPAPEKQEYRHIQAFLNCSGWTRGSPSYIYTNKLVDTTA